MDSRFKRTYAQNRNQARKMEEALLLQMIHPELTINEQTTKKDVGFARN